ncbi:MAG: hypothetical protein IAE82_08335 [Opitutaceae bacterium]|nr:hypothetical protein [Opitutaceae bacterium]
MSLVDDILGEPEFRDRPPVLVDIGAAGGVHRPWRKIARYAIGVGFEPDVRDTAALSDAQRLFRRWVFVSGLAVPTSPEGGVLPFHLTRSPQCSSVLRPDAEKLAPWTFSSLFEVVATQRVSAVGLLDGLRGQGIEYVDWLKCDTQGMDLRLFRSLPDTWRHRVLAAEMEPGFIDAYEGEDRLAQVLETMRAEPFWMASCNVQNTPRGRAAAIEAELGSRLARRHTFFGAGAPGWANLAYLLDFERAAGALDRRSHLLGWVFAELLCQPAAALDIAVRGSRCFGDDLFRRMRAASRGRVRRAVWRGWLRSMPRRLLRR